MFGYIKPMTPELKLKEHELYKSIYCGLCIAMGNNVCQSSRFTLSYDIVFLALIRAYIEEEAITVIKEHCFIHPIKKKNHAYTPNALKYCAQVSALLAYYNLIDDVRDNRGFASLKYRMMMPAAKSAKKRISLPLLDNSMVKHLTELSELENEGGSLDRNADCFGRLLGDVFAYDINDPALGRLSYEIGYHTGKWIYMIDAADDLKRDKKSGAYNPLSAYDELPRNALQETLDIELSRAYSAFAAINNSNKVLEAIITNILTLGMPDTAKKILEENK